MKAKIRVINIRGTNGSGKTHLVRKWMQDQSAEPYPRRRNLLGGTSLSNSMVEYYRLKDGGIVMGTYENACGGCDNIKSRAEIERRLEERLAEKPPYLIFEGVIVSHVFEGWHQWSQRHRDTVDMAWVFLDTPVEECLKRVAARNRGKPINEKYVHDKHRQIGYIIDKARKAGEHVVVLPWKRAYPEFVKLIWPPEEDDVPF